MQVLIGCEYPPERGDYLFLARGDWEFSRWNKTWTLMRWNGPYDGGFYFHNWNDSEKSFHLPWEDIRDAVCFWRHRHRDA